MKKLVLLPCPRAVLEHCGACAGLWTRKRKLHSPAQAEQRCHRGGGEHQVRAERDWRWRWCPAERQHGSGRTDQRRPCGRVKYASGLATAGTYATAPTKVQPFGPGVKKPGVIVQTAYASNTGSTTATINTQVQTGTNKTITPTTTISLIRVMAFETLNDSTAVQYAIAQLSRGTGPTLIGTLNGMLQHRATRAARHP